MCAFQTQLLRYVILLVVVRNQAWAGLRLQSLPPPSGQTAFYNQLFDRVDDAFQTFRIVCDRYGVSGLHRPSVSWRRFPGNHSLWSII